MKTVLKWVAIVIVLVVVAAGCAYAWASSKVTDKLSQTFEVHSVDVPVPFPLSASELDTLREERRAASAKEAPPKAEAPDGEENGGGDGEAAEADAEATGEPNDGAVPAAPDPLEGVDLGAIALERAIARGKHLVEARYACIECHGKDFGGGTMVDDPMIGTIKGPNITSGKGSRVKGYEIADWDHIVRHGILPNGNPAAMPAEDFRRMSDQELSDIIAYIRTVPPVDREIPRPTLGPLGKFLMATGELPLSAEIIGEHHAEHIERPPQAEPTAEFGHHLAGVCTGCHRESLEGGPVPAGPPDWPPAANITPHQDGLGGWTFENFVGAMREGVRPDGTPLREPMSLMKPYAANMTDVELRALWAYLQSVDPLPTPK